MALQQTHNICFKYPIAQNKYLFFQFDTSSNMVVYTLDVCQIINTFETNVTMEQVLRFC